MSGICPDCLSEARHSAVQLFCQHVLMTKQRVGISEGLANLDSSLEEFDCCVVFLLQTEAVTSCTPSLKQTPCLHVAYCDCYYLKYRIYNAGPEDVTKQHFCKIPGNIGSKSAEFVVGSDSLVTLTHSLTHSQGQHSSLRLRGSKLQKRNKIQKQNRNNKNISENGLK